MMPTTSYLHANITMYYLSLYMIYMVYHAHIPTLTSNNNKMSEGKGGTEKVDSRQEKGDRRGKETRGDERRGEERRRLGERRGKDASLSDSSTKRVLHYKSEVVSR